MGRSHPAPWALGPANSCHEAAILVVPLLEIQIQSQLVWSGGWIHRFKQAPQIILTQSVHSFTHWISVLSTNIL